MLMKDIDTNSYQNNAADDIGFAAEEVRAGKACYPFSGIQADGRKAKADAPDN